MGWIRRGWCSSTSAARDTSMTRRKARAVRGMRARGAVPRNRGPVTTLLAGVSVAGMSPAMTVEGGTDTAVFATYLQRFLLPSLAPGTVIVVDNVGAHQPDRIRQLVAAALDAVTAADVARWFTHPGYLAPQAA